MKLHAPRLERDYREFRRNEKDYLLRGDLSSIASSGQSIAAFREYLATAARIDPIMETSPTGTPPSSLTPVCLWPRKFVRRDLCSWLGGASVLAIQPTAS